MKIITLDIENFQSHNKTHIEFSSGFNAIIGQSDQGKSAILRSLNSLFFKGKFYLKHGASQGSVVCSLDSGNIVGRFRTVQGPNVSEKFTLNKVIFRKIGKKIPEEIIAVTKLRPIVLTDESTLNVNLQGQHDGKFLLSDSEYSEAYRARVTSIQGSETLDMASMEAAKGHREVKGSLLKLMETEIPEVDLKLQEFEDIEALKETSKSLHGSFESLRERFMKLVDLQEIHEEIKDVRSFVRKNLSGPIKSLEKILEGLSCLRIFQEALRVSSSIKPTKPPPDFETIKRIDDRRVLFKEILSKIPKESYDYQPRIQDTFKEYKEFLKETKTCPTCERNFDE